MSNNHYTLHAWPTPNSYKIAIMLEECDLQYGIEAVNISNGEQFKENFLALNPNNKMPVLVDHQCDDFVIIESGAILLYLAEKTGLFLSSNPKMKSITTQWLMWQMGGFGPMLGQAHHFRLFAPQKNEYGIKRYSDESKRLYDVLNKRLAETGAYVAGADYSIADMAILPWSLMSEFQGIDLTKYPEINRWIEMLQARPPVQRGLNFMKENQKNYSDFRVMQDAMLNGKKVAK